MFQAKTVSIQKVNRMYLSALHAVNNKQFIGYPTVSTYLFLKCYLQIASPGLLVSIASLIVFDVTFHNGHLESTLGPICGNILITYSKVNTPVSTVFTRTQGIETFLTGRACALQERLQCFRDGQVLMLRFVHVRSFL